MSVMTSAQKTEARIRRIEEVLDESEVFIDDPVSRAALVNALLYLVEDEVRAVQPSGEDSGEKR